MFVGQAPMNLRRVSGFGLLRRGRASRRFSLDKPPGRELGGSMRLDSLGSEQVTCAGRQAIRREDVV